MDTLLKNGQWLQEQLSRYDTLKTIQIVDGGPSVGHFVQAAKDCLVNTPLLVVPWVDIFDREKALLMLVLCSMVRHPTLEEDSSNNTAADIAVSESWMQVARCVSQLDAICDKEKISMEVLYATALIAMDTRCPPTSENGFLYQLWQSFRWIPFVAESCGDLSLPLLLMPEEEKKKYFCDCPTDVKSEMEGEAAKTFLSQYLVEEALVGSVLTDRQQLLTQAIALRRMLLTQFEAANDDTGNNASSPTMRVPLTEMQTDPFTMERFLGMVGWIRSRWICHERKENNSQSEENVERASTNSDAATILSSVLQLLRKAIPLVQKEEAKNNNVSTKQEKRDKKHKGGGAAKVPAPTSRIEYCVVPVVEKLNHSPSSIMCPTVDWGHSISLRCELPNNSATTQTKSQPSTRILPAGTEVAIYYGCLSNNHLFTRYGFLCDPCILALGVPTADTWSFPLVRTPTIAKLMANKESNVKDLWMDDTVQREERLDEWEVDSGSLWRTFSVPTAPYFAEFSSPSMQQQRPKIPIELLFSVAMWAGGVLSEGIVQRQEKGSLGRHIKKTSTAAAQATDSSQQVSSTEGKFYDADPDDDAESGMWQFDRERMIRSYLNEEETTEINEGLRSPSSFSVFWNVSCDVLERLLDAHCTVMKQCLEQSAMDRSVYGGVLFWAEKLAAQRSLVAGGMLEEVKQMRSVGPNYFL